MLRILRRFNRWYDRQREPWRLLLLILMVMPPVWVVNGFIPVHRG